MRTALALAFVAALLWSGTGFAQPSAGFSYDIVAQSPHNFAGANAPIQEVCRGCHLVPDTPQKGLSVSPAWAAQGAPIGPFNVGVRSPDGSFTEFANTSQVCLQCHDGVMSVGVNPPGATQAPHRGGSNHPDHPVLVDYPRNPAGDFIKATPLPQHRQFWSVPDIVADQLVLPSGPVSSYQPAADTDPAMLMGSVVRTRNGKVHCESCHNPHDNTVRPFLRKLPPKLCLVCHDK